MKKQIFIVFIVALIATSCGFTSKEVPIKGTENLVTYTVEDSKLVGIKENGEKGNFLTSAAFISVEAYAGFLFAKIGDSPEIYGIYRLNGKPTADVNKAAILKKAENYRVVQFANGNKWVISPVRSGEMSSGEDAYISGNFFFTKEAGRWGIFAMTGNKYDRIVVVTLKGKPCYIVHDPKSVLLKKWTVWVQKSEKSGEIVKTISDAEFGKIEANLPAASIVSIANADGFIISFHDFDVSPYIR